MSKVLSCQSFVQSFMLYGLGMSVQITNMLLLLFFFFSLSGLLSMQWIAEAATLTQASSQYGHLAQWWMTAELKVLSPLIFCHHPFFFHLFYFHPFAHLHQMVTYPQYSSITMIFTPSKHNHVLFFAIHRTLNDTLFSNYVKM